MTSATTGSVTRRSATVPTRARADGPALLAAVAVAAIALIYVVAVRTPTGQTIDTWAMVEVSRALAGETWTHTVLQFVSPLGVATAAGSIAVLGAARGGWRSALHVMAIVSGTIGSATVLKAVLVRPEFLSQAGNSLPSGHVAAVAGLAVAAAQVAPRAGRLWIAIPGAVLAGLTAVATLALRWHRPSDVAAAALVAVAVGAGLSAVRRVVAAPPATAEHRHLRRPAHQMRPELNAVKYR